MTAASIAGHGSHPGLTRRSRPPCAPRIAAAVCQLFLQQHPSNEQVIDVVSAVLNAGVASVAPAMQQEFGALGAAVGKQASCEASAASIQARAAACCCLLIRRSPGPLHACFSMSFHLCRSPPVAARARPSQPLPALDGAPCSPLQVSLGLVLPTILAWQLQHGMAASIAAHARSRRDLTPRSRRAMVDRISRCQEQRVCGPVAKATQGLCTKLLLTAGSMLVTHTAALLALGR